jgi:hypothetical protein
MGWNGSACQNKSDKLDGGCTIPNEEPRLLFDSSMVGAERERASIF